MASSKKSQGLHISAELTLPLDAVTEALAILAVRRAGKSNAAVVMAEEMHRNGLHWIAIDPKGDWYGIRSSADGKGPGLPIVIFGGRYGDVPLEPGSGAMIADAIIDERISCVLDVSNFESEAQKIKFLLAFGDRLFRRKSPEQEPTHVFFEEIDDYCPQRPFAELIVSGKKDVENRSWYNAFTGPFLIHASKTIDLAACGHFNVSPHSFVRGALVGAAVIVRCTKRATSAWHEEGMFGFYIERPVRFEPVPCRGHLGFFSIEQAGLDPEQLKQILNQVTEELRR